MTVPNWAQPMIPGLQPIVDDALAPFVAYCGKCDARVLDTQPITNVYPDPKGNLRLIVADGELHTEAVPISQHQLGEHLHLAHVVTCRPRKTIT